MGVLTASVVFFGLGTAIIGIYQVAPERVRAEINGLIQRIGGEA